MILLKSKKDDKKEVLRKITFFSAIIACDIIVYALNGSSFVSKVVNAISTIMEKIIF